jgi:hypothetical protein
VYTVKLTKRLPNYRINGTLYISKQNFAIFKFEYAIRRILTGAAKNKRKVNSEILFEVVNEYKPKYGKMYLNYISFHNIFQLAQPPELIVKEVIADRRRRFFEVRLNKKVDPVFSIKRSNYKFRYLGERVKFKNVVVLDDKVRLYPNLDAYEIDSMFALINDALQNHETLTGLFDTQIKGLRTVNADGEFIRLNERKLKSYHQFREFFVQEVKPNAKLVQDSLYMNKLQPIFKDQPFVKPDNFGDYWMNTPLKTVQE